MSQETVTKGKEGLGRVFVPERMVRAPSMTAFMPDAHTLFTSVQLAADDSPACRAACRPGACEKQQASLIWPAHASLGAACKQWILQEPAGTTIFGLAQEDWLKAHLACMHQAMVGQRCADACTAPQPGASQAPAGAVGSNCLLAHLMRRCSETSSAAGLTPWS